MSKLNRLKEQLSAVNARIREEESKLRESERTRENRRKYLAGAMVLARAKRDSDFAARLMEDLKAFVVRNDERALFNFPPLPKQPKPKLVKPEKVAS